MLRAQVLRHGARVGRFVEPRLFKPHGKSFDRASPTFLCLLLHQRDDGRRINPTRQERAQRHIGQRLQAHRFGQPLLQRIDRRHLVGNQVLRPCQHHVGQ